MKQPTPGAGRAVIAPPRKSDADIPFPGRDDAMVRRQRNGWENGAEASVFSGADRHFAEVLHELANGITALHINTQVLDWKLPPHSHLKRSVREIERHAQRCSGLVKRLLAAFKPMEATTLELCQQVPGLHGPVLEGLSARIDHGLDATNEGPAKKPAHVGFPPASGSSTRPKSNSHRHVTCALAPASRKRNDGHEY